MKFNSWEFPLFFLIVCHDFEEITNEGTAEDYLFDSGHMTRQGAIIYTNWLVDRLQESSKTACLFPVLLKMPKTAESARPPTL